MVHSMGRPYVGPPTHGLELERVATSLAPAHVGSHELWWNRPIDRIACDSNDGSQLAILATSPTSGNHRALSRHSRRCSAPAAHVSPQQLEVIVADLVTPRRHGRRFAIEDDVAEALEIVLGKLA
jgi:hypothetical protein